MNIYLIRHAEAIELGTHSINNDFDRPLTAAGQTHSERLATALPVRGVRIERIFVSPLVRAQQTAEPMVSSWGLPADRVITCDELKPGGDFKELAERITELGDESVALVGHRPDLNEFAAWLIGNKRAQISLKKGAVACVQTDSEELGKGAGELAWLLPPDWV